MAGTHLAYRDIALPLNYKCKLLEMKKKLGREFCQHLQNDNGSMTFFSHNYIFITDMRPRRERERGQGEREREREYVRCLPRGTLSL